MSRSSRSHPNRKRTAAGHRIGLPAVQEDFPFTLRLPDGRTLFVLVPAKLCERDVSGEVVFLPDALRFIDRIQSLAMRTPDRPTPSYIRTLREALGLTQAGLAARLGVNKMTVARWEWGKSHPAPEAVRSLDALRRAASRRGIVLAA